VAGENDWRFGNAGGEACDADILVEVADENVGLVLFEPGGDFQGGEGAGSRRGC